MSDELKTLNEKVEKLLRLVATGLVAEKSQSEQIMLLTKSGFTPKEIATIIGTTSNTVSVTLNKTKKTRKKRAKKR